MKVVYLCTYDVKNKVKKILEQDPTAPMSFARQGYDFKDGKDYGVDGWVLYISGDESFIEWAEKQLGDLVKKLDDETANKIIKKIEEEKDKASEGFGQLFG